MAEKDIYISKIHGAKIRDEELTQKLDERCEKIIEDTSSSFRAVDDEIEDLRTQVESNLETPPLYMYDFEVNQADNYTLAFALLTPCPRFHYRELQNGGAHYNPIVMANGPRLMLTALGSIRVIKYDGTTDDTIKIDSFSDVSTIKCNGKTYDKTDLANNPIFEGNPFQHLYAV